MDRIWKFFTSLRLTVVCLAFGILIVFLGTWAQVDEGLYGAQSQWFRSYVVWFDFFGWKPGGHHLTLPLPGGYTLGFVLLANLIAAHIKRFTWAVNKIGIQLTHLGVILLLAGQLATDQFAKESHLGLREGQTKNYTEDHAANELVFVTDRPDGSDNVVAVPEAIVAQKGEFKPGDLPLQVRVKDYQPNADIFSRTALVDKVNLVNRALTTMEAQYSVPDGLTVLAEAAKDSPGRVAVWQQALMAVGEKDVDDIVAAAKRVQPQKEKAESLCKELRTRFRAQMLEVMGMPRPRADRTQVFVANRFAHNQPIDPEKLPVQATEGVAPKVAAFPLPESKDGNTRNLPMAIVEVLENGKSLGSWLLSPILDPQEVKTASGQVVRMGLRFKRYYLPFTVKLLKATHEIYPGTATDMNPEGIPKNFQSRVQIDNPTTGDNREVDIYMNNPLRYAGLTFFQYQMGQDEMASGNAVGTSTLQVVRNPGWLTPYFGCAIVALGMVYQFLYHLVRFIGRRGKQPPAVPSEKKGKVKKQEQPVAVA